MKQEKKCFELFVQFKIYYIYFLTINLWGDMNEVMDDDAMDVIVTDDDTMDVMYIQKVKIVIL
ncbi:TPA: hypothetical protein DEG21_05130 [Patescibacteria group bacterium]|nr:hypothetical protein [Candidatus Gracilibacteria bacterium]HBY75213.1 hypothetical protein [Candidatus Gracilibacteria bacterium]